MSPWKSLRAKTGGQDSLKVLGGRGETWAGCSNQFVAEWVGTNRGAGLFLWELGHQVRSPAAHQPCVLPSRFSPEFLNNENSISIRRLKYNRCLTTKNYGFILDLFFSVYYEFVWSSCRATNRLRKGSSVAAMGKNIPASCSIPGFLFVYFMACLSRF